MQSRPSARPSARATSRAAVVAVTGAVLALASTPAASAATGFKPHPHHATAATTTWTTSATTAGRGHKPPHHRSASPTRHGKPGAVRIQPRTAAAHGSTAPAVTSPGVRRATPSWVEPAAPNPAPARPAATDSGGAKPKAPAHDSTWQRADSTEHADRGVVRAFASDLKQAGQSAGFPALLVAVMVGFLLLQHRLDRRDVKLSHADWVSDQGLEFSAPATVQR